MSLIIALVLAGSPVPAAAEPAATESDRWVQIVQAAHQMGVSSQSLYNALRRSAANIPSHEKAMCFDEGRIVAGSDRTICHSESQWREFGLELLTD